MAAALLTWNAFDERAAQPTLDARDGYSLLVPPKPLPDFSLRSTRGGELGASDLRGRWTLLSLGFASCPDVCPRTLAALSRVARANEQGQQETQVIFVSVDPERDSIERLAAYVGHFGSGVVGATGSHEALEGLAKPLGLFYRRRPAAPGQPYAVEHSTNVLVVSPEAEVVGVVPAASLEGDVLAGALRALQGVTVSHAEIRVSDAYIPAPPPMAPAAAYLVVENFGPEPVRIVGAEGPCAVQMGLHRTELAGGVARMRAVEALTLAPREQIVFEPGGLHVMLHGAVLAAGDDCRFALQLSDGRRVRVAARVRAAAPETQHAHAHFPGGAP